MQNTMHYLHYKMVDFPLTTSSIQHSISNIDPIQCTMYTTRNIYVYIYGDDRGFSESATKSRLWFWISKYVFKHTNILRPEEWRDLSTEQPRKWCEDRHYVIPMRPHGLLPIGAILNGLTWAGGGARGITTSGAELSEPATPGKGLHQRWFRGMHLRACVATGAAGLFAISWLL